MQRVEARVSGGSWGKTTSRVGRWTGCVESVLIVMYNIHMMAGRRNRCVCVMMVAVLCVNCALYCSIFWSLNNTPPPSISTPPAMAAAVDQETSLRVDGRELPDFCKGSRGVPEARPVQDYDLFRWGPFQFLEDYRNPCWHDGKVSSGLSCLPYFYLAGFPMCGTSDLWDRIVRHPDVIDHVVKEPDWLSTYRFSQDAKDLRNYTTIFTEAVRGGGRRRIVGDGTVHTVWKNENWYLLPGNQHCSEPRILTADYLRHLNPKAKIIIVLRNPINRLYSAFKYFSRTANVPGTEMTKDAFHELVLQQREMLETCLTSHTLRHCVYNKTMTQLARCRVTVGLYHVYLLDWFLRFPRDQIHIIRLEDLSTSVTLEMRKVFGFLGLEVPDRRRMSEICSRMRGNVGDQVITADPMLPATRRILHDLYRPHNQQLAHLLHDKRYLWLDTD